MGLYGVFRYNLIPPVFLVVFTFLVQVLVFLGNPNIASFRPLGTLSSPFAWKVVAAFYIYNYISLIVPSKTFYGPPTPTGVVPRYSSNGCQFYVVSMATYAAFLWTKPEFATWIYEDFAAILSVLSLSALLLCVLLVVKGFWFPEHREVTDPTRPYAYLFYSGMELHPRLFGVDVKQWTNCRVGMLGWALLVFTFAVAGAQKNGLIAGPVVNAFLINLYLLKFFYWETGYFNTLDIILDRAGYYLCWGCLCWVQVFYTFSAYFMVAHPSKASNLEAGAILALGVTSLILNYMVDYEKELFRTSGGKCDIWGKPPTFLAVKYTDPEGNSRQTRLLTSGFWGISRHMNYVFELLLALSWSLPARHYGLLPFAYIGFLFVLLVHRCFRDEEKCARKYGQGWLEYCQLVRYRMVPGIF